MLTPSGTVYKINLFDVLLRISSQRAPLKPPAWWNSVAPLPLNHRQCRAVLVPTEFEEAGCLTPSENQHLKAYTLSS